VRAGDAGLTGVAAQQLAEGWKAQAGFWFNLGGLVGALLTVPLAARLGRRSLFTAYYGFAALAMVGVFGIDWSPEWRLTLVFFIGLSLYGVFAAFNFYLPELFPPRLRGLGAGFSYNIGRLLAAFGPFLVGTYSAAQSDPVAGALSALLVLAAMPLTAALLSRCILETHTLPEGRRSSGP
jgi:MFS family permease